MKSAIAFLFFVNAAVAFFSPSPQLPTNIHNIRRTSNAVFSVPGQPHLVGSACLRSSSNPDSESDSAQDTSPEETLLRMNLSINAAADPDAAIEAVRAYVRSFPFAAILPVQPLQYVPSDDGLGVKVTFLRKKTKEKGSQDGGIDFSIEFTSPEDEEEGGVGMGPLGRRIRVVATRISEGQTVSKMFSEKLIVTEFVKGISGSEPERSSEMLSKLVSVDSVFHKWMS
mmetsp:Transcript_3336/g.7659  ORF Transcript_3336/g.7659 Transcript_3336/m.7659 type:complete len:227 (-) Transcript_3336:95-775(-)